MNKKEQILNKNVQEHTIDAHTIDHHLEESFPTLLDFEGTLADCYLMDVQSEMKRSK